MQATQLGIIPSSRSRSSLVSPQVTIARPQSDLISEQIGPALFTQVKFDQGSSFADIILDGKVNSGQMISLDYVGSVVYDEACAGYRQADVDRSIYWGSSYLSNINDYLNISLYWISYQYER